MSDQAKIARRNKSRSQAMERRLAVYFNGNRVPMSGSGQIKGDLIIPFDEYRSIYIECKLTEKPTLNIPLAWLGKIKEESKLMRCVFGVLIYTFMHHSEDYVMLEERIASQFLVRPTESIKYTTRITVDRSLPAHNIVCEHGSWWFTTKSRFRDALQSHEIVV